VFAPLITAVTFALGVLVVAAGPTILRQNADFSNIEDSLIIEHPLNDAWLGMPVHMLDGKPVGYVSDVIMQPDGQIAYILVKRYAPGAGDNTPAIRIPVSRTQLLDTHVAIRV
jgi:hypothetical protein